MKLIFKTICMLSFCLFEGVFLTPRNAVAQTRHADFSGTWVLNKEKSVYEGLTLANLFNVRTVRQDDKSIIIESLTGEIKTISILNLDGSPVESKMERPTRKRVSTIKWLNNRSFETTAIDDTGKEVFESVSVTTLMPDGKTMTIDATVDYKPNNSVYKYHLILDKQTN